MSAIIALHKIGRRLPEALGNIYIVPVGKRIFLFPVGGISMNFIGKLEQPLLPRSVIKPVNAVKIVASAAVLCDTLVEISTQC